MSAGGQLAITVAELFQIRNPASGYVRIQVPEANRGFWRFFPTITGHARIRVGQSASTVIPLARHPLQDSFILSSGTGEGQFQGIALVNPTNSTVSVELQALRADGSAIASTTISLAGGQISSRLLTEYFATTVPESSLIRVTASAPIIAVSITGTFTGDLLRSLIPVR
jgi:hypothetical protein